MFRWMLFGLAALVSGVLLTILATRYPAHVTVDLGDEYLRAGLYPLLLVAVLATWFAGLCRGGLRGFGALPSAWRRYRAGRSRKRLLRGLTALDRGDWRDAARLLKQPADPEGAEELLRCLGAARAAWRAGRFEDCESLLQRADGRGPEAELCAGILRARIQASRGHWEQGIAVLKRLSELHPGNTYLHELLLEACLALRDWSAVLQQIDKLRWPRERGDPIRRRAARGLLEQAGRERCPELLERTWKVLPRRLRLQPELLEIYTREALRFGPAAGCEPLLRAALKREFSPELVRLYARVGGAGTPGRRLAFLEELLQSHPRQPVLLEAAALLCARLELWGKARSLYETALGIRPAPGSFLELARLLERRENPAEALDCYRRGLEVAALPESPDSANAERRVNRELEFSSPP